MKPNREVVILASRSPRRRALLEAAGYNVDVRPQDADETWPGGDGEEATMILARRKLETLAVESDAYVLAADTAVICGERILGKPATRDQAIETIQILAGGMHRVVTGVCVRRGSCSRELAVTTRVWFRPLSLDDVERYVDSGESMDKAGAYGIQGIGGTLVDRVEGSYTNVIGLPLAESIEALEALR